MRKTVKFFAVGVMAAALLTGCGGDSNITGVTTTTGDTDITTQAG